VKTNLHEEHPAIHKRLKEFACWTLVGCLTPSI